VAEGRDEQVNDGPVYRWLITLSIALGYVMLAGVLTWALHAYVNRGIGPATGCPAHLDRGHWYLVIPELGAILVILVTRRHTHRWYGLTALGVVTLGLAFVAFFFAYISSTPGICFD
jgi:hypothetical protein